jgi:branched-chain amino acid transport system substrate-binding protein
MLVASRRNWDSCSRDKSNYDSRKKGGIMSSGESPIRDEVESVKLTGRRVSRREFLKYAGIAGATVGMGVGLGGLAAACGGGATTTTAGATTTTAGATSTTAGATTTVSAVELGREIKLGYCVPLTGPLAGFAEPSEFIVDEFTKNVWKDGLVLGDGKKHPIKCILQDTQSDTNRAAQVAGDLITLQKVDILGANGASDTVNPVADQGEALGCPTLTCGSPNDSWWFGRGAPAGGFKWCYHFCFTLNQFAVTFTDMWLSLPTNKKVAWLLSNDADGKAFGDPKNGIPPVAEGLGFTLSDPGMYTLGTEDYSAEISRFKKDGCEVLFILATPPDFANFWKQSLQQGFKPKIAVVAKAVLFPSGIDSLGATIGQGLCVEAWWHPTFPYVSALTGITAQELASRYEAFSGRQWTDPIVYYSLPEVWTDVLQRAKNPEDKNSIIEATKATKLMTIQGPVDYTIGPFPNSCTVPVAGSQWVKATGGKYPYQKVVVNNKLFPDIPLGGKMVEIPYSSF